MSARDLLEAFRALHERARRGGLPDAERATYLKLREQLAQTLLLAQGLTVPRGSSARQSFRVAVMRRVEFVDTVRPSRAMTRDISAGGFSALIDHAPEPHEVLTARLDLGLGEPLETKTKAVNTREHAINSRVSYAFVHLTDAQAEQLEVFLFDAVLARIAG